MASRRDSPLNSSPASLRGDSPVRQHRSSSPIEIGESISRSRVAPSVQRSFDPNDPDVRERQRTMDVDMAIHLSRARRETLPVSPAASPYEVPQQQRQSPHVDARFPITSDEQRALGIARGDLAHLDEVYSNVLTPRPPSPSALLLRHVSPAHDPDLLVSIGHPQQGLDGPPPSLYGLPVYQNSVSRSVFDFSPMEQFAVTEKLQLGIESPEVKFFGDFAKSQADPLQSPPPPSELSEALSDPAAVALPRTARQRKLSHSIAGPRLQRKGVGGKMALFENTMGLGSPSLPNRLGLAIGSNLSALPSAENLPPAGGHKTNASPGEHAAPLGSRPGILNTGHDRPYRFSFYSNALSATIHARSLSELPADDQTFQELFTGVNSSDSIVTPTPIPTRVGTPSGLPPRGPTETSAFNIGRVTPRMNNSNGNTTTTGTTTTTANINNNSSSKRGGETTKVASNGAVSLACDTETVTWWLDIQSPTDEEMKVLSKVFSIHPLTTEDILTEEAREKIELFRHYYLVCFRSFDQDPYSPTYLEPLNMYIIVFKEGTLSFHFSPTPHPQNVRRRIKQLKDYISVTSDWISYALIDDITDAFGPLIQSIEYEVDSIDELVLILKDKDQSDMLRRIGTCRKKVMGLLRLMGNKADVVKGLAKRCNENWRVAPTSDIGLYLSDIQDHLITMTQSLNHYEKILSRSHSNYLAQISIEMTDANNQINDVLSKLTAIGTILIPMNLVTGLWGMNVHVPGQGIPGYGWFVSIVSILVAFAVVGGYTTYRFILRN